MKQVTLINGPNLNLLGTREPATYGPTDLRTLEDQLTAHASATNLKLTCHQSNHEGELIDLIQKAQSDFIIINAAAYTHTSIAIRDALLAKAIPFIEVHITNLYTRETFRSRNYLSDIATGVIMGCGTYGYEMALNFANQFLNSN